MKTKWRFVGVSFEHMHMGGLLQLVHEHPQAEIVGICDEDPRRMDPAIAQLGIPKDRVYTDYRACLEKTRPDVVILCSATARHAEWTQRIAPFRAHLLVEKPFAASLRQADAMISTMKKARRQLVINWPIRWFPCYITAKRLLDEGLIGRVIGVHHHGGNRGPLHQSPGRKSRSWFYQKASGGGSMLDYLGYGVTLGTWFHGGKAPLEISSVVDRPPGLEVDEHSITVARYDVGLSKFETRWGTFTDPWVHQPQPKCGFVVTGTKGTISAYDYARTVRIQTRDCPEGRDLAVDKVRSPFQGPIQYLIHCLDRGMKVEGPLSPSLCRIGQQIVDSAVLSVRTKRVVQLLK